MAIIRKPRPESNYYQLDKTISEDTRLSWGARGLLIFLLGKPDNWKVSIANLVNQTQGTARPSGRDAVYSLLNELIQAGYVTRSQKNEKGRFSEIDYDVCEKRAETPVMTALTDNQEAVKTPITEVPLPAEPLPAEPHTANPIQTINDFKQELKESNKSSPAKADEPNPLQIVCRNVWASYSQAIKNRYGVEPIRNKQINSQIKSFCTRLPAEEAPLVAAFYVSLNEMFYVNKVHSVGLMLADAEKLRMQMLSGVSIQSVPSYYSQTAKEANRSNFANQLYGNQNNNGEVFDGTVING